MILAIDIGNTNIVVGCCKDNKVSFVERISTNHTATELEYAVSIKTILELYNIDFSEIDGAIIIGCSYCHNHYEKSNKENYRL